MLHPHPDTALHILRFCTWRERGLLLGLSREWADAVRPHAYKYFCELLEEQALLYVPPSSSERSADQWRAIFLRLLPCVHVWQAAEHVPPTQTKAQIEVCARFRPRRTLPLSTAAAPGEEPATAAATQRVILPLHQRLQLIKASHGCSTAEAQKRLWAPGKDLRAGDDPFSAPKGMSEVAKNQGVVVLGDVTNKDEESSDKEGSAASEAPTTTATQAHAVSTRAGLVAVDDSGVVFCAPTIGLREFRYGAAFGPEASQAAVYERSLRPLLTDLVNGRSGCLLAFGQTGSGKTFTMSGPDEASATHLGGDGEELSASAGILPRALRELLDATAARRARTGVDSRLHMSMVEIYGEDVTDLLRDGAQLGAWRGVAARAHAEGRADVLITSAEEATAFLLQAERAKRRAATAMNERSSRAHAVLSLTLEQTDESGRQVRSTLCLADLGGSEQLKRSRAQGEQLREAVQINMGLLALKNCVTALTEGARYVPYQNSKLTQLLMPGLSGRAQAVVIVCASSDPADAAETLEALRFGELAAVVESSAKLPTASLMAQTLRTLDAQIAAVEARIVERERWEMVVETRVDERAAFKESLVDTGVEEKRTFKLVGAEAEREMLEELLERRRELLGEPRLEAAGVAAA